jgi:outer membrane protein OmpA-like peptidoglycan-associated protein
MPFWFDYSKKAKVFKVISLELGEIIYEGGDRVLGNCRKTGFWVCLLIALIVGCTWSHRNDPKLVESLVATTGTIGATAHTPHAGAASAGDRDGDGLEDALEIAAGLDPHRIDTDGDGKSDAEEGLEADRDGDGVIDALESAIDDDDLDGVTDEYDDQNTDPDNDSDGDGFGNGLEKAEGTDPLDARSTPPDHDHDGIPDDIDADRAPIAFAIVKKGDRVMLEGTFSGLAQIATLQETIEQTDGIRLENGKLIQNQHRDAGRSVEAVAALLPFFLGHYDEGVIRYERGTLSIGGYVRTAEEKSTMQALLDEHAGLIHYIDATGVKAPETQAASPEPTERKPTVASEPIAFAVIKEGSHFRLEGTFGSIEQIAALQGALNDEGVLYENGSLRQEEGRNDNGTIDVVLKLLPHFTATYLRGAIRCDRDGLHVEGEVPSLDDRNTMRRLLAAHARGIDYDEHTAVTMPPEIPAEEKQAFLEEVGSILAQAKITFRSGSSRLTEEGKAVVKRIGNVLKAHPHIRVEIGGHTDSDGDDAANLALSQARVERVRKALTRQGIDPFRLRAKGYGETRPVSPNDTPENKAKNRRVEFTIIGE